MNLEIGCLIQEARLLSRGEEHNDSHGIVERESTQP